MVGYLIDVVRSESDGTFDENLRPPVGFGCTQCRGLGVDLAFGRTDIRTTQ